MIRLKALNATLKRDDLYYPFLRLHVKHFEINLF